MEEIRYSGDKGTKNKYAAANYERLSPFVKKGKSRDTKTRQQPEDTAA